MKGKGKKVLARKGGGIVRQEKKPKEGQRIATRVREAQEKSEAKAARKPVAPAEPAGKGKTRDETPKPGKRAPSASGKHSAAVVAAFERWKGGTPLHVLPKEAGVKRSKLRRNFIELAGGKPAFSALRSAGAGGTTIPFGGKRSLGRKPGESVATIDDAKVKRLPNGNGLKPVWKYQGKVVSVKDVGNVAWRELVHLSFVGSDGTAYVRAKGTEKADLIIEPKGLPLVRLRRLEDSSAHRAATAEEKLIARGKKAARARREKKRAAKNGGTR